MQDPIFCAHLLFARSFHVQNVNPSLKFQVISFCCIYRFSPEKTEFDESLNSYHQPIYTKCSQWSPFPRIIKCERWQKNSFHFERAYNKEILSKPSYNPMKTKAKNASPIPSSSMDIKDSIPTVKGIQQSYSNSLEDCSMSKLLVFLCVKSETSYLTTHLFSFNVPVCPLGCCTFWWGIP